MLGKLLCLGRKTINTMITEREQLILDQYEAQCILLDAKSLAGTEFDADNYGVSDDLCQFVATHELHWQHFQERLNFGCLLPYVDYDDHSYGYTEHDFLEMLQDAKNHLLMRKLPLLAYVSQS